MVEREEPEQSSLRPFQPSLSNVLWTYILGLARAGVEELQDKPSAAEIDRSQKYDYIQTLWTLRQTTPQSGAMHSQLPEGSTTTSARGIEQKSTASAEQMRMSAVPHSHYLDAISVAMVITSMYSTEWQDKHEQSRCRV